MVEGLHDQKVNYNLLRYQTNHVIRRIYNWISMMRCSSKDLVEDFNLTNSWYSDYFITAHELSCCDVLHLFRWVMWKKLDILHCNHFLIEGRWDSICYFRGNYTAKHHRCEDMYRRSCLHHNYHERESYSKLSGQHCSCWYEYRDFSKNIIFMSFQLVVKVLLIDKLHNWTDRNANYDSWHKESSWNPYTICYDC